MRRFITLVTRAFIALGLLLAGGVCTAAEQKPAPPAGLVWIEQVEVRASMVGHVVLLKVQNKAIPIFVDAIVAESIQGALTGQKFPRPLSHDLMHSILQAFDGKVSQAVISLQGRTYHADLTVLMGGTTKVFDSRSSDAIALAIHFKAPMLVSQELVDKTGAVLDEPQPVKPGETRL